jgi:hypothetical protein
MYPHMSNVIDTLFEGAFETIQKSHNSGVGARLIHQTHQKTLKFHSGAPPW